MKRSARRVQVTLALALAAGGCGSPFFGPGASATDPRYSGWIEPAELLLGATLLGPSLVMDLLYCAFGGAGVFPFLAGALTLMNPGHNLLVNDDRFETVTCARGGLELEADVTAVHAEVRAFLKERHLDLESDEDDLRRVRSERGRAWHTSAARTRREYLRALRVRLTTSEAGRVRLRARTLVTGRMSVWGEGEDLEPRTVATRERPPRREVPEVPGDYEQRRYEMYRSLGRSERTAERKAEEDVEEEEFEQEWDEELADDEQSAFAFEERQALTRARLAALEDALLPELLARLRARFPAVE
jgi:hypothetical protein